MESLTNKNINPDNSIESTKMMSILTTNLCTQIQFKLLQELFLKCHNFPPSFDFGAYMGYQLVKFIPKVGEVSTLSWFCLGLVFVVNLIRTLVDNSAEDYECRNQPLDQLWGCGGDCSTSTHRYLASSSVNSYVSPDMHCYLFFFSYAFFCSFALNVSIYGVYYASCYYETSMAYKSVEVVFSGIEFAALLTKINILKREQKSKCLSYIIAPLFENNHEVCVLSLQALLQQRSGENDDHEDIIRISGYQRMQSKQKNKHIHETQLRKEAKKLPQSKLHTKRKFSVGTYIYDTYNSAFKSTSSDTQNNDGQNISLIEKIDVADLFWRKWPDLYFFMLEFVFLLQSVYLAMYFTQLLPLAVKSGNVGWGIALIIMPCFGVTFLYFTLRRSVLLYAMTELDPQLAGKVCEETSIVLHLAEDIRTKIYEVFRGEQLSTEAEKMDFIKKNLDPDQSNSVDRVEFRTFLGNIEIYLSKERFDLLWNLVDYDLSGSVSLDEILVFLFPEMKSLLKQEMKLVETIRQKFQLRFQSLVKNHNISEAANSKEFLRENFENFDTDKSGAIDKSELRNMIESLGIEIENDHVFKLLMAATETNGDGEIEFQAFVDLVMIPSTA